MESPGFAVILSFVLMQPFMEECFATTKRHLCVHFEMEHKRVQDNVMSVCLVQSKGQCMIKCAADARCTAFNFRSADGLCELLPDLLKCYEPDDNEDFLFTQLKLPDFKPPMTKQSKPLDTGDLQWVFINSTTVPSSSNIKVTESYRGYIALGFNKGMYIPAYWPLEKVRMFYPPGDSKVRCHHGYLLSVKNPELYRWVPFHAGSPLPIGSVSAGQHVDGTSLYIARVICGSGKRSGFYSPSFGRAYVDCKRPPINLDGEMEILSYVWYELRSIQNDILYIRTVPIKNNLGTTGVLVTNWN